MQYSAKLTEPSSGARGLHSCGGCWSTVGVSAGLTPNVGSEGGVLWVHPWVSISLFHKDSTCVALGPTQKACLYLDPQSSIFSS